MNPLSSLAACQKLLSGRADGFAELASEALARAVALERGEQPIHAFLSLRDTAPCVGPAPSPGASWRAGGCLAGVPIAVKDNICTTDFPTTCGSRMLQGYVSPYSATAVRRLEAAGAWILGKTNLDEFGMGSSTEHSAYGPTRNPADRSRVPGGSSGGSAAAVAAGAVPAALGSSTGGSVRQPAALCGIVGLKPTYGRVSRYGLVAFASSLDHIGVLARSVRDAATVLEAIAGFDRRDATSQRRDPPRADRVSAAELAGRSIGIPGEYLGDELDDGVRAVMERTLGLLSRCGARITPVSLPSTELALACYYVIAPAEASSNLARYDGVRFGRRAPGVATLRELYGRSRGEGFGDEVKRRIVLGTHVLSAPRYEAFYVRALQLRRRVGDDIRRVLGEVDAIFAPTTPSPAFPLGSRCAVPTDMYRADLYTVAANLAGIPALSVPIGDVDGLPVGGQLMCGAWEEEKMCSIGAAIERLVGYDPPRARGVG
jgi:aspartyl-tRNA(Asn)/glutamyl-tRNA(Gln) amidotransferase subunit A